MMSSLELLGGRIPSSLWSSQLAVLRSRLTSSPGPNEQLEFHPAQWSSSKVCLRKASRQVRRQPVPHSRGAILKFADQEPELQAPIWAPPKRDPVDPAPISAPASSPPLVRSFQGPAPSRLHKQTPSPPLAVCLFSAKLDGPNERRTSGQRPWYVLSCYRGPALD